MVIDMTENKRFNLAFYDEYDGTFSIQDKLYWKENKHLHSLDEIVDLLNELSSENKKLEKENLDLSEELDYYKTKCASLETGLFQADRENGQLLKENKELQGKASSWKITASEQIMEQSKLMKENEKLKQDLEHCANQFKNDGKNVLLGLK